MALIAPTSRCNEQKCIEVINVCWATGQNNMITSCHPVSADLLLADKSQMSINDTLMLTGILWTAIALAGIFRLIGRSLIKF